MGGGWIAGGQLDPSAADMLIKVAMDHSETPAKAKRTIMDGLRYGAQAPLTVDIDRRQKRVRHAMSKRKRQHG